MVTLEEISEALGKSKGEILSEVSKIIDERLVQLTESLQPKPEDKPKPDKKQRFTALEEVTGDPDAPAPIGNSHEAFLAQIRGFSTSDIKGARA